MFPCVASLRVAWLFMGSAAVSAVVEEDLFPFWQLEKEVAEARHSGHDESLAGPTGCRWHPAVPGGCIVVVVGTQMSWADAFL